MFGYVTPMICEMKVREHELYQAYYCGLCKALKREYGKSGVLNYDCTFIYLLGDSLTHSQTDARPCSCILHPVRKRRAVTAPAAEYAAAVNVLMAYAKLRDDAHDDGAVSVGLRLLFFKKAYRRAARNAPRVAEWMERTEGELRALERAGSADTDEAADPYARLFGSVLMELDVVQSHILYDIGYGMGRWVYLIDACDDIERDLKKGGYNVFVNKYGLTGAPDEAVKRELEFNFNFTLSRVMDALGRLELKKNREILQNIVCLGLRERTRRISGDRENG